MKIYYILATSFLLIASCKSEKSSSMASKGEEWVREFAKEQFGEKYKYLVKYNIVEASIDSTELTFVVDKFYEGKLSQMPEIKVFFDKNGNVDDSMTRLSM